MNLLKPKISRPAPLPDPAPEPASTTTSQLAPKSASYSQAPLPKKETRKFRIDIGSSGYGSGLNIPT